MGAHIEYANLRGRQQPFCPGKTAETGYYAITDNYNKPKVRS